MLRFTDDQFDALLPEAYRLASTVHWTPLSVCLRAAKLLNAAAGERVLDVGSGVGKFCIAAAASYLGHYEGAELRADLVHTANSVARELRVRSVTFHHADALTLDWSGYAALYFFNPFYGHRFEDGDGLGAAQMSLTTEESLQRAVDKLSAMPSRARVVTWGELGAKLPPSYSLLTEQFTNASWLRLYEQR